MKKLLVSLMLVLGLVAFAAESAPSATVGYVKYSNVAGDNFVALPMQSDFTMASSFEAFSTDVVSKWDNSIQKWTPANMLWAGFWDGDFAVTSGTPYFIHCSAANDLIIDDEVVANPAYNLVVGDNTVMVPLDKSSMTMASSYETETGSAVTTVSKWDNSIQKWTPANMLWAGFWDGDFAVSITDPHMVYSGSALTWPSSKTVPQVTYESEIPHSTPKGTSKTVYVGLLQPDGTSEYDAGTIGNVTFQAWLEQGTGSPIAAPSLGPNGRPEEPYTQVTQLGDYLANVSILGYRGAVSFNMQEFDTWGIDNVLNVVVKDESDGLKVYYENSYSWIIDDTTTGTQAYGMEPLMPGTGAPMALNIASSIETNIPFETKLEQNYPNPFNPTTTINFSLKNEGVVKLNVYNYTGQLVNSLVNGQMNAGYHTVNFDASNLSAGVYYYTLEADNKVMTNKMVLVK